jgi:hypothetical protein
MLIQQPVVFGTFGGSVWRKVVPLGTSDNGRIARGLLDTAASRDATMTGNNWCLGLAGS